MIEEYRDIPGYDGKYQVSNFGNVKSLNYRLKGIEKVLKPRINDNGYFYLNLYKDKKQKTFKIHQLVAIVFLDHKPNGMNDIINHKDNFKLNNRLDNLEITTPRVNSSIHKKDAGVNWHKRHKRFQAHVYISGKLVYLGYYDNIQDGLDIYEKAVANQHLYKGNNKEFRKLLNS